MTPRPLDTHPTVEDDAARCGRKTPPNGGNGGTRAPGYRPFRAPLRATFVLAALCWPVSGAQNAPRSPDLPDDLTYMSMEDLVTIRITSVARKPQPLSKTAAAIHVVTSEDIRRSGATSIPEALRMVPGVQVAQIDSNKWAVTARGFNGRFANKLLVLIDGRTVYTPSFGGMYWETNLVPLDSIERIEVIRGPGATMWGSNAVNGVINIITKHARDTQGTQLQAGVGNLEHGFGGLRFGARAGANAHYRVYTSYFNRDNLVTESGVEARDRWAVAQGGFRLDWQQRRDSLLVQGDLYNGRAGQTLERPQLVPPYSQIVDDTARPSGGNLLARWTRSRSQNSDTALQWSYTRYERPELSTSEISNTMDVDLQQRHYLTNSQELVWGAGYRLTTGRIESRFPVRFQPEQRRTHLYTAFVQDEFSLVKERLNLMLGSRFEHNSYSGFEIQPTLRVLWTPSRSHSGWAAVSRAVRSPTRLDHDFSTAVAAFPQGQQVAVLSVLGDGTFASEKVRAHEVGYRFQSAKRLSFDTALFYNVYSDLRNLESARPFVELSPSPPHLVLPLLIANSASGETYGVEVAANWIAARNWRVSAAYSYIQLQVDSEVEGPAASPTSTEEEPPRHQAHLRSYLDLPAKIQFDTALYFVDSLPVQGVASYIRADARISWRPSSVLDFSLALQNLLDGQHTEFSSRTSGLVRSSQVRRNVYGKITWRLR